MRVVLVHNNAAGSELHTDAELVDAFRSAGHVVEAIVSQIDSLPSTPAMRTCDLVVTAGGDGTVGRVARLLAHSGKLLSILPLGTANNTARALGIEGDTSAVVGNLARGRRRAFDLVSVVEGTARDAVTEAIGWGVFPAMIKEANRISDGPPAKALEHGRKLFGSFSEKTAPRRYAIQIDGDDCSGDYLLVEIVNIPFIGPQLEVSPGSDPGDGRLEVVLATEAHRDAIGAIARREQPAMRLPRRTASRILIRHADEHHHRDGDVFDHPAEPRELSVTVEHAALEYLVPS